MPAEPLKDNIKTALKEVESGDFLSAAKTLLAALGYKSSRVIKTSGKPEDFFPPKLASDTLARKELLKQAKSLHLIFQFTNDEIEKDGSQLGFHDDNKVQERDNKSFMFVAAELKKENYSRSEYAAMTREINKRYSKAPAVVLFRTENKRLILAFVHRRPNKRDGTLDVLGEVSLVREIDPIKPHRAHVDILAELSLVDLISWMKDNYKPRDFDGLLAAWLAKLDIQELNKKFYKELFGWYDWAIKVARFPLEKDPKIENHVIRLITRVLFVWFIKEKHFVAEEWFNPAEVKNIIKNFSGSDGSDYYRVVLQNLFFATLNTDINNRQFSSQKQTGHRVFSHYRYLSLIADEEKFKKLMKRTPFVNGGLFDCLDSVESANNSGHRIDMFSDPDPIENKKAREKNWQALHVPDDLFFNKKEGLFSIFNRYKFTVEENTPIEQEVALDPELLGMTFENLLAAYNPETQISVRNETGSFYTPRAIVGYMVEQSIRQYLLDVIAVRKKEINAKSQGDLMAPAQQNLQQPRLSENKANKKLDALFNLGLEDNPFDDAETKSIIAAIDNIKVLDPAVGSGAFSMEVLHCLVRLLAKLDSGNKQWKAQQLSTLPGLDSIQKDIATAEKISDDKARNKAKDELERRKKQIRDNFNKHDYNYLRKLYLIQNCIYGVDIQPVACQIAKLRFFISLAIEQKYEENDTAKNYGIEPLPNLETRFVAADTLRGFKNTDSIIESDEARVLKNQIANNRKTHFAANSRKAKLECIKEDKRLRDELVEKLQKSRFDKNEAQKIAEWEPFDQNMVAEWFDAEYMFNVKDGFDIVLGNPPYIQLQQDGGRLRQLYEPFNYSSLAGFGDIYCLFYERANQLLKDGGYFCFITSNKWMRADYGKKLRNHFIYNTQPLRLLDLGPDIFETATVDTNILLAKKFDGDKHSFEAASIYDREQAELSDFNDFIKLPIPQKDESWIIISDAEQALKKKIEKIGTPLKDWDINIYRGVLTGCNDAFIIDTAKRNELIAKDKKSADIIKPVLRGRDISRYQAEWAGEWLINTHNGYQGENPIDINDYPTIKKYLNQFYSALVERADQGITPYNLRSCAYLSEFEKEKIAFPVINRKWSFPYANKGLYILAPMRFISANDRNVLLFIQSVLSSNFIKFIWKSFFGNMQDDNGYQMDNYILEKLPIPDITSAKQKPFVALMEKILAAKKADPAADTGEWENEIDRRVYELYELNKEEIEIIKNTIGVLD